MSELLTVRDIATRLRVTSETVRRWLRAGALRGIRLSDRAGWRVPAEELERFLSERARWETDREGREETG